MKYYEKLHLFFKSKGLSQTAVGQKLGYSKASMSKFINGNSAIDSNFILVLVKEFPEIDLQYIFSETEKTDMVSEPQSFYGLNDDTIDKELELIGKKVANVREYLAQKSK
jgi:transcriptional regulator with XRE-family HTH domain